VLTEAGYATALIADVPHLQRPGRNFHRGYKYYEWVRGQENDYYTLAPRKQPDYLDLYPGGLKSLERVGAGNCASLPSVENSSTSRTR